MGAISRVKSLLKTTSGKFQVTLIHLYSCLLVLLLTLVCGGISSGEMIAEQTKEFASQKQNSKSEVSKVSEAMLQETAWLADNARLVNLSSEKRTKEEECNITWNILWNWAKKGNLEARAKLGMLSYSIWPLTPQIFLPGRSGDELSSMRDAAIFLVNSVGVKFEDKDDQYEYEQKSKAIYDEFLSTVPLGKSFSLCLKEKKSFECKEFATTYTGKKNKKKLVPSFENFSKEVDALVNQGLKPHCLYFNKAGTWRKQKQEFILGE